MSRIGKQPIAVPEGVSVVIDDERIEVSGPKGSLAQTFPPHVRVSLEDGYVKVARSSDQRMHRAMHGLTRALIANMVTGVKEGFTKTLEVRGTGYRAQLEGKTLVLRVGFSHEVRVDPNPGIDFAVEGPLVRVLGIDKQAVGQQAAEIRRIRPPEPYKGKGIRYAGEWVRRKAGKSAVAAAG